MTTPDAQRSLPPRAPMLVSVGLWVAAAGFLLWSAGIALVLLSTPSPDEKVQSFDDVDRLLQRVEALCQSGLLLRATCGAIVGVGFALAAVAARTWSVGFAVVAAAVALGRFTLAMDTLVEAADPAASFLPALSYQFIELFTLFLALAALPLAVSRVAWLQPRILFAAAMLGLVGMLTRFIYPSMIPTNSDLMYTQAGMQQILLELIAAEYLVWAILLTAAGYYGRNPSRPKRFGGPEGDRTAGAEAIDPFTDTRGI